MKENGFTLIELLVSLGIVSVLAAFAVPQYQSYRQRAYDARALHDLRAVALAQEVYFIDHERYVSCQNEGCTVLPGIATLSRGTQLSTTGDETQFTIEARHEQGSGRVYHYSSENGGVLGE